MKLAIFCTAATACLMVGCAPKVVTDVFSNDYAALPADSVQLFLLQESVPKDAIAIGKVKVVDNGFSVKGSYERVLNMAIEATAQNGGNGLVVERHRSPDLVSTINRVWGTMLRLPQTPPDSVITRSVDMVLAQAYFDAYKEDSEKQRKWEALRSGQPRNILRISAGPSWLKSQYYLGNHLYKSRLGFEVSADYDHVWKSGFGFGVNYLHNYTSFDEGIKMRINYFGPSLVIALPISEMFRIDMALGFGCAWYTESYGGFWETESHIAPLCRLGGEYKIGKNIAAGLQMNMFSIHLDEPEGVELDKDEFYGIQRLGLQAGLRFYF